MLYLIHIWDNSNNNKKYSYLTTQFKPTRCPVKLVINKDFALANNYYIVFL